MKRRSRALTNVTPDRDDECGLGIFTTSFFLSTPPPPTPATKKGTNIPDSLNPTSDHSTAPPPSVHPRLTTPPHFHHQTTLAAPHTELSTPAPSRHPLATTKKGVHRLHRTMQSTASLARCAARRLTTPQSALRTCLRTRPTSARTYVSATPKRTGSIAAENARIETENIFKQTGLRPEQLKTPQTGLPADAMLSPQAGMLRRRYIESLE